MVDIGIGRLAELTGVKIPTIRFYEQNDLVPPPGRTKGGQRRYDDSAVRRLHFIRHARDLGFTVEDIRQLLALSEHPTLSCDAAAKIAHHHLQLVEGKIARLRTHTVRTEAHDRGMWRWLRSRLPHPRCTVEIARTLGSSCGRPFVGRHVCFWHLADINSDAEHVRSWW